MKRQMRAVPGTLVALAMGLMVGRAWSTPLYWDSNGTAAGAGATPTGTWGTSNFWNTDSTGGAGGYLTNTPANSDDLAVVAAPGAASGNNNFTITVSGAQVGRTLTLQAAGNITISGGTSITLGDGAAGGISVGQYAYGTTANGAHTISTPITLANAQTILNSSANILGLNGNVNNGGYLLTLDGTGKIAVGTLTLSGNGGLTKNGSGNVTFQTATLSYTGPTIINGGGVMVFNNKPAGNFTLNGGMLSDYYRTSPTAFSGGLGTGNNQIQIFGDSGFGGGNGMSTWVIGTAGSTLQWGSTYFNPTSLKFLVPGIDNLGPSIYGQVTLNNGLDLNGAARTIFVTPASGATPGVSYAAVGVISDTAGGSAGSLIKTGGGYLQLTGANTYRGTTTINTGVLVAAVAEVAGTSGPFGKPTTAVGSLLFGGGTLQYSSANQADYSGRYSTGGGQPISIDVNGRSVTNATAIQGGGTSLTLADSAGGGTLTITGACTYDGATTINSGTLRVSSPGSLGAGSTVNWNGGALTGTGTVNGPVNMTNGVTLSATTLTYNGLVTGAAGANYVSPAGLGTLGTLTLGAGLTLNAGNEVDCDLGTTTGSSDVIAITGDLTLNGTSYVAFNVPTGSAASNATYTLMTWTGTNLGGGTLVFPNGTTTMNGANLNLNANSVTLTTGSGGITTGSRTLTWFGTASYAWDSSTSNNWKAGGVATRYAYGDNVTFDTNGVAASPITGLPASPASVTVNSASGKDYNIAARFGGPGAVTKSGTSTLTLSGNNSFSGGLVMNAGTLRMSGPQSFTGGVTLNGGVIGDTTTWITSAANNNNSITVATNATAGFKSGNGETFGSNVVITINSGATLDVGPGRQQDSTVTYNGVVQGAGTLDSGNINQVNTVVLGNASNTFSGNVKFRCDRNFAFTVASLGDAGRVIVTNSLVNGQTFTFNLGSGATAGLTFNTRQFVIAASGNLQIGNYSAKPLTINTSLDTGAISGGRTLTLAGTGSGLSTFGGLIANGGGSVALTKSESGTWSLSGANTYTGATAVAAGTLSVNTIRDFGVASALGAPGSGAVQLGSGANTATLEYTGGNQTANRTFQIGDTTAANAGGGTILNDGSGALVLNAANFNPTIAGITATRTLTLGGTYSGGANQIQGIIQDSVAGSGKVAISVSGVGTWKLSGANTFNGTTTVSGGSTLTADYSTQDNSKLSDTAALALSGGTLILNGGTHVEVVSNTLLNAGGTFLARSGGSTGKLRMNAITRAAGGTIDVADATLADTDTTNVNSILGGYATLGNDWAINSTGGADGAITALAAYTGTLPQTGGANTANYTLTGPQTQTGTVLANTARIAGSGAGDTLALGGNALTITSASATQPGGILYVGGGDGNYSVTGTGNGLDASGAFDLIINTVTGTLNVSAKLNGSNGARTLVKTGAGTLVVASTKGYTGTTYVNQGALRLANATAAGTTAGGITVQNGAAVELTNNITVGGEALTVVGTGIANGGALRNCAGNTSTYGGAITIGAGGARVNADAGGSLTLTGGVVTAIGQDVTFGGHGNTTVQTAGISGAGSVTKDGTGTLTLVATNTYTGETRVNGGTLAISGSATLADGAALRIASGAKANLGTGVNEVVGFLYLDGLPAAAGTWGGTSSAADNKDVAHFSGTGIVTVQTAGSGTRYAVPSVGTALIVL